MKHAFRINRFDRFKQKLKWDIEEILKSPVFCMLEKKFNNLKQKKMQCMLSFLNKQHSHNGLSSSVNLLK